MRLDYIEVEGMTCGACVARIEKSLRKMKGIQTVQVSLALSRASIRYEPKEINLNTIVEKIVKLGYGATDRPAHPHKKIKAESRAYRTRFFIAACLSFPLLWMMAAHLFAWPAYLTPEPLMNPILQWILATLLQFGVGFPFYHGAYKAMLQRTANMDTLVVISTSVAYFYSHYAMFHPNDHTHTNLYFDTIAMVMTAVLLGKWFEAIARGKALKQLNALYTLQEKMIRIIRYNGEEWIGANFVQLGDRILVKSGEWISVDGVVQSGEADVDESMMSGESATVPKRSGDRAYAGTRCLTGSLHIMVDKRHHATRLSQVISLIEGAQQDKPAIQRAVDQIAAIFVPVMLASAAVTYLLWVYYDQEAASGAAMRNALSVLLIACPCALGLATPVSILIASGSSARRGVLFKQGSALEQLRRTDVVLLDKTGTLTEGTPRVSSIHSEDTINAFTLRMASALAIQAAHPIAHAIVQAARKHKVNIPDASRFQEFPGKGMQGIVERNNVCVGSRRWLEELEIDEREGGFGPAAVTKQGHSIVYVVVNGQCIGTLTVEDRLRLNAQKVVQRLQRHAEVWLVTGDQEQAALSVSSSVGIDRVRFGMLPEQKIAFLRELQSQGRMVAMVGDGINDAAALAAADVGIAMGGGADAAKQAGDVILHGNNLTGLLDAYDWSRRTMRNVHQNLFFALLYNLITVPLAAFGFLDPRIACIGMAASSVLVVCNSLRLSFEKRSAAQA